MALVSPWQEYNVSAEGGKLPEKDRRRMVFLEFFPGAWCADRSWAAFCPADGRADSPGTAVLSTYSFWMRRYSADRNIIGRTIYLDAQPHTVIGVLPESFTYESAMLGQYTQAWTRVSMRRHPT